MKKLSILVAAIAAVAFTSCETSHDDNPVLLTHEGEERADFLNDPVMQDQYIDLTEDNSTGYLELTCSQPTSYGYAASVRYIPQISLTSDFSEYYQSDDDWSSDCSDISLMNGNAAEGICELLGATTVDDIPSGYYPLYVRLKADVYTDLGVIIPNTTVISNVVEFKYVHVDYLAITVPGMNSEYYLRGSFDEGWAALPEYNFITTDTKNVWEISNLTLAAGTQFKVADANWGAVNCGAGDNATITVGENYTLNNDSNSGNITLSVAFTGTARLTLSGGTYTLLLIPASN